MTDTTGKLFDAMPERRGTASYKWDRAEEFQYDPDILPLWVADMDFESPLPVREAMMERVRHGVYGYPIHPESYYESVIRWFEHRFSWIVQRDWIVPTPGVVPALNLAVQTFTLPGERVIIQPPVYFPFARAIANNERRPLINQLINTDGRYLMDCDALKSAIDSDTKVVILCNPHNPVGRVWTREELEEFAAICLENQIIIVSDEIHADLVFEGHRHIPLASLSEEIAAITITCTSPSKTFNLAGLAVGNMIIPNKKLRELFSQKATSCGLGMGNIMAISATEAAYGSGESWVDSLLQYLWGNYSYLDDFIRNEIADIRLSPLEGTYLAWLDFRKLGLTVQELNDVLLKKAKVWLVDGAMFGPGGEGFQRLNIASPSSHLEEGLTRIRRAFS